VGRPAYCPCRCKFSPSYRTLIGFIQISLTLYPQVLSLVEWAILVASTHNGLGRHVQYVSLSQVETVLRLNYFSIMFWSWAVTCIKISIALMILRLKNTGKWRIALNGVIALQVVAVVVNTLLSLLQCRPISATWKLSMMGSACWSLDVQQNMAYGLSGKQHSQHNELS
jgi:hypothetical protein